MSVVKFWFLLKIDIFHLRMYRSEMVNICGFFCLFFVCLFFVLFCFIWTLKLLCSACMYDSCLFVKLERKKCMYKEKEPIMATRRALRPKLIQKSHWGHRRAIISHKKGLFGNCSSIVWKCYLETIFIDSCLVL